MIYWFYGQPGSGKTTLGNALKERLLDHYEYSNIIRIDGDEMRNIFQNKDYSEQGRRNNLRKVNDLIRFLYHKDYTVIVSVVAPYKDVRDEIKDLNPTMIYLHTSEIRGREDYFAKDLVIGEEDIQIDTTNKSIIQALNEI
jgi:adenylylsulfate kinase-like enzyme